MTKKKGLSSNRLINRKDQAAENAPRQFSEFEAQEDVDLEYPGSEQDH